MEKIIPYQNDLRKPEVGLGYLSVLWNDHCVDG